ncbi:hypothetical protein ACFQ7G_32505 [Streptomyces massasporeus]
MSDQTPSQAEGERAGDEPDTTPRPTPSQAEGDRDDADVTDTHTDAGAEEAT